MVAIPESARGLPTSNKLAHLATVNPDGSPQQSIVWVGLVGDDIVFAHLGAGQKIKNLRREPRVVLSVEGDDVQFPAMDDPPPGVVVHITPERIGGVGPWAE